MIAIRPLEHVEIADLERIAPGYTSTHIYDVTREESEAQATIALTLRELDVPLTLPFRRTPDVVDYYQDVLRQGLSLGAYDDEAGDRLVGVAITDVQAWNGTLLVWEFHLEAAYRGRGLGRRLMEALAERAAGAGLRVISVETSTTNVPAIRFYRRVGFSIDSIDLSFYSNEDIEKGDVVVFMKRKLTPIAWPNDE
ncbi:MAG: GNAT family N-acetyltransferase [Anaerolineae bacterium]|nr:GNAT family N-acetyltransferase [Anaerolineae bacterium]